MLRFTPLVLTTCLMFLAGSAQAVTITFSDYAGSESGNTASFSQDGYDITVTSAPSDYDLTIGSDGLGVGCTASGWGCFGNDPGEIDASHGESITVDFGEVVRVYDVELLNLYSGWIAPDEQAAIEAAGVRLTVDGEGFFLGDGALTVDLGGVATSSVSFAAVGMFYSDFSVKSVTIGATGAAGGAGAAGPSVPEPGAALVFAVGLALVGRRARRG